MRLEIIKHTSLRQGRVTTVRVKIVGEGARPGDRISCEFWDRTAVDFVVVNGRRLEDPIESEIDRTFTATFRIEPRGHGQLNLVFRLVGVDEADCPSFCQHFVVAEDNERQVSLRFGSPTRHSFH